MRNKHLGYRNNLNQTNTGAYTLPTGVA